jgi:hypothetical protein
MSCVITDLVGMFSADNTFIPERGAKVVVTPGVLPIFIKNGSVFRELPSAPPPNPSRILTTDDTGQYSITLPWPSETDPTTATWIIQLPDNTKWSGVIPEGIAGPLSLHNLTVDYGWTLTTS